MPIFSQRADEFTCSTHFVVGDVCQVDFSLGDIAVAAPADGVGVVVWEGLALLAGVEAEDATRVLLQGFFAPGTGLLWISGRVFGLADLGHCAAAVPAIGRVVGLPERVAGRQRDPIEGRVFRSHLVIVLCAVLEIISVAVRLNLLPLGRHVCRSLAEVVLCPKVVLVAGK